MQQNKTWLKPSFPPALWTWADWLMEMEQLELILQSLHVENSWSHEGNMMEVMKLRQHQPDFIE